MEIEGKVIAVLPVTSGVSKAGKPWKSMSFVVEEVKDQFPQSVCLDLFGDDKINETNVKVGENVKVQFNVSCRQFGNKWYNSLRAWRVEKDGNGYQQPQQYSGTSQQPTQQTQTQASPKADIDSLPF